MPLLLKIRYFFTNTLNLFVLTVSGILTINTLLFFASQGVIFSPLKNSISHEVFYATYIITTIFSGLFIYFDKEKIRNNSLFGKLILIYLPSEIIFIYGLQEMPKIASSVGIMSALYILAFAIFIIIRNLSKEDYQKKAEIKSRNNKPDKIFIAMLIITTMAISFYFGSYHLGKMAIVDEPLWTFDRIPNFWRNIKEKDWKNAKTSDKPGLTVAALSGIGLFSEPFPKQYKEVTWEEEIFNFNAGKMESFNFAFRFPILVFRTLALPLFYFLIRKLAGNASAIFSTIFIGLSPLILGNSRIINPDSILWIFTTLSLIYFLTYLKEMRRLPLYLSAFLLGLAVLTKYTATILYPFFIILIFAEYVFHQEKYSGEKLVGYLRKKLTDFGLLIFLSFSAIYVFYPAVWGKPSRIFILTIHSQAFEPVWPMFASLMIFILLDVFLFKNRILSAIMSFFVKFKKQLGIAIAVIFLLAIFGVMLNVYTGMSYYDFEEILSSPKSSFYSNAALGFFLTNFYPLVFGVSSVAIVAIVIFLLIAIFFQQKISKDKLATVYCLILFILIYYSGSVASQVASIIRYQIMVFPVLLIASGIAIDELMKLVAVNKNEKYAKFFMPIFSFILISILTFSLWKTRPFYMGYASFLLPEKYYLDVKDMGEGSYEAAEYLNTLPNAGKLSIWTDKRGVCTFFIGKCYSSLSQKTFSENNIDYFVVSSGRKSRTVKMSSRIKIGEKTMQDIYDASDAKKIIEIAGRSNNFVKILASEKIK